MSEERHMGVLRQWINRTTTVEWLYLQRAFVRHVLALVMMIGFLSLATLEILGTLVVNDAAVAGFLGVALGYLSAKLDYVVKFYFGRMPTEPGFLDSTMPDKPAPGDDDP